MALTDTKTCKYCSKTYLRGKRTAEQWEVSKWCSPRCLGNWRNGENHFAWKEVPGYAAIHKYVANHFEPKKECERCGKTDVLHWANKTGKYLRERNDWLILCPKCHSAYDENWKGRIGKFNTHCKRGHEMTDENIYVSPKDKIRSCRACWKSRYHENKAKSRGKG